MWDFSLVPEKMDSLWATYSHWNSERPIFIGATKLTEVFMMTTARTNSEWLRIVAQDEPLAMRLEHIGTMHECQNKAGQLIKIWSPVCNMQGFDTRCGGWMIQASDGRTWHTQQECAHDLKTTQSQVSKVINRKHGHKTIRGVELWRVQR